MYILALKLRDEGVAAVILGISAVDRNSPPGSRFLAKSAKLI